jgi:hypothetical protein
MRHGQGPNKARLGGLAAEREEAERHAPTT